jgi:cytochrome c
MKTCVVLVSIVTFVSCGENSNEEKREVFKDSVKAYLDYIKPIPGKSDSIPEKVSERGEVLIAYSDCYSCHTIDKRSKGPAFKDIAKRYPVTEGYVALLAQRIILGGSGMWGYSVMTPHADLREDDAKTMVKFILSLKE